MRASDFPKWKDGRRFRVVSEYGSGEVRIEAWRGFLPVAVCQDIPESAMIADALERVAEWEEQEQANLKLQTENQDN